MTETTTTTRTYQPGDEVVIRNTFTAGVKYTIVEEYDEAAYIIAKPNGEKIDQLVYAAELAPYIGSDLHWKREGRAMYADLKARHAALLAALRDDDRLLNFMSLVSENPDHPVSLMFEEVFTDVMTEVE